MNLLLLATGKRAKWLVLAGWTAIVLALLGSAMDFESAQNNRDANYLPKSAESLQAIELEERAFGDQLLTGLLVYNNPNGLNELDKAAILSDVADLENNPLPNELGKPVPLFFEDGKTAAIYTQVRAQGDQEILFDVSDRLRSLKRDNPPGLETALTGQTGFFDDTVRVFDEIDGNLLLGTVALITLLLLLIYRSPFLWLLPLLSVGAAEISARGFGTLLAENGVTITSQAAALMTVLVFGVGTDYALLLIARYREELRVYEDRHEAMRHALKRSAPAIFASAATVIAALLCLMLANVNATSGAGPIAAMGIGLSMLAMLTLLPALLLVFDRRVFWPFVPETGSQTAEVPVNFWSRLADRIARRPVVVTVGVFAVMAVMATGLLTNPGGLDLSEGFRDDVESVRGQEILERALPPGATGPMTVLVEEEGNVKPVVALLKQSPDVASVGIIQPGQGATRIEADLKYAPYSDEAIDAIPTIRGQLNQALPGAALVSGATAVEADSRSFAADDNRLIMPLVLLVVLLILVVLMRSVVAPIVLMITVVASFCAILGASYVIFDMVFGFPGVDEYVPIFVFIFLVALGVDYNIFLMARVREEALVHGAREGMRRGLIVTGGVITSAGVVLAGTFLVLAAMPIVSLTEIGFAIAMGVLFDALVVRTLLVPALGFLMGSKIWWPAKISDRPPPQQPRIATVGGVPPISPAEPVSGAVQTNHDTNRPAALPDADSAGTDTHRSSPPEAPLPDWTRVTTSDRYR